jgi:hypothetical protein
MTVYGTNATLGNVRFSAGYEGEADITWSRYEFETRFTERERIREQPINRSILTPNGLSAGPTTIDEVQAPCRPDG